MDGMRCVRETTAMIAALVLTGAPGTGKSSALEALTTLLEIDGVPHGAIESEQLAWGSPLLAGSEWVAQLEAVLALQRTFGRRLFLIAATVESAGELRSVLEAANAELSLVVCLRAPAELLAARLDAREPERWPGKAGLIAHARELALRIPGLEGIDIVLDTDGRGAEEVAVRIRDQMSARGLLEAHSR